MIEMKLADGRPELYRWDTGRRLSLSGVEPGTEVQFATSSGAAESIAMVAYQEGEQVLVDVPDELLARNAMLLLVYIWAPDDTGQLTKLCRTFQVMNRPQPTGYVGEPEKAKTWAELEERIKGMDEAVQASAQAAEKAADTAEKAADAAEQAAAPANQAAQQAAEKAAQAEALASQAATAAQAAATQTTSAESQAQAASQAAQQAAQAVAGMAPMESAIKVSGTGTGLVSLSPTVAWGLQGLQLYGRTTQDSTPDPENPVPLVNAGDSGSITVQVTDGGAEHQQMIVQTPSGLPGIPVDSGGNFTDENGQQWISDTVDFMSGIKTQNTLSLQISLYLDTLSKSANPNGDTYFITLKGNDLVSIPSSGTTRDTGMLCNYFVPGSAYRSNPAFDFSNISSNLQNIRFCFGPIGSMPTLEEARGWFSSNDVFVLYPLANPITAPLSDEELATYSAPQSYSGTTNIIATDCGLQATVVADGTKYMEQITQRLAALESDQTGI